MATDAKSKQAGLLYTIGASLAISAMAVGGVALDNPGELSLVDCLRAAIILTMCSIAIPIIGFRLGGPFTIAAFVFPVALFCFFRFLGLHPLMSGLGLKGDMAMVGALVFMGLICAGAAQSFRMRDPVKLMGGLCIITGAAAMVTLGSIVLNARSASGSVNTIVAELTSPIALPSVSEHAPGPDIIYIMPDRYAGEAGFRAGFNASNRPFMEKLRARGFFVAEDARANYAKTFQSTPSTFNMTPLEPVINAIGADGGDRRPLYRMYEDNAVQATLRSHGYRFQFLGNWWGPSNKNRNADVNFYGVKDWWSQLNEFEHALLRTTPVAYFTTYGGYIGRSECTRLKAQLDYLKNLTTDPDRPTFTFAHLTIPHAPVTMNRDGECTPHRHATKNTSWEAYRSAYIDYVGYLNDALIRIFDANKTRAGSRGLIFVIQADEGPYPERLHRDGVMDMFEFTPDELQTKFSIINAVYWDTEKYGPPSLTQTPVNNWRIIFSRIFGADLPLIADERSMQFRAEAHPFEMRDVTELLAPSDLAIAAAED